MKTEIKNSYSIILLILTSLISFSGLAQENSDSAKKIIVNKLNEDYILRQNLWLNSSNASGLGIKPIQDYSILGLKGAYDDAGYRASYNGSRKLVYGMDAYGYKALDKIYLKGGFSYEKQDEDNLDWALMMDSDRNCPFILADSVGGDWKKDYYKLDMIAGTTPIWKVFRFGLGMNYNVSTGGRDNDPRPKSLIKDLKVRPSLAIDFNAKNSLGLSYIYEDYRQDINVMNKYGVGGSMMYKIMGLALKEKPIMKSSIEYRIDRWNNGAALQYGHQSDKLNYIAEVKYKLITEKGILYPYKSNENIETGELISDPEEDYKFSEKDYSFYGAINYNGTKRFHYFKLNGRYGDSKLYNLTTEQVELKRNTLEADATYELYTRINEPEKSGKFALSAAYKNSELENLYYAKQTIETLSINGDVNKSFNKHLLLTFSVRYSHNLNSELVIDPKSDFIEPETDITDPYVIYNYDFATANTLFGQLGLTYYHLMNNNTNLFIGCKAGRLQVVDSSSTFENKGITSVSLNIGILF